MPLTLDADVRRHLADYLAGKSKLNAFEEWFVPNALSLAEEVGDQSVMDLIYEIELRLAEYSHGDWTSDELKSLFQSLVQPHAPSAP